MSSEKIIDPRLEELNFDRDRLPLFIVPATSNEAFSNFIKNKIMKKFGISCEVNSLTNNVYLEAKKGQIPSIIEFVKGSNYIQSLEYNDMKTKDKEGEEM
ncbi:MAG: hypothetical protein BTN85_0621 [Candidatus Methanohalarchaeum thermophilum]|uniref:Uncharacterized protein n=1 Tax=Methanohalarchaeum thermophilum TaxID=1903181 RepID=A0A1Q6DUV8_METT1|nr:MAG: hypothetical protein BTN85_0621 [Candidatus Methanohalarchaeum thermophilum]